MRAAEERPGERVHLVDREAEALHELDRVHHAVHAEPDLERDPSAQSGARLA